MLYQVFQQNGGIKMMTTSPVVTDEMDFPTADRSNPTGACLSMRKGCCPVKYTV